MNISTKDSIAISILLAILLTGFSVFFYYELGFIFYAGFLLILGTVWLWHKKLTHSFYSISMSIGFNEKTQTHTYILNLLGGENKNDRILFSVVNLNCMISMDALNNELFNNDISFDGNGSLHINNELIESNNIKDAFKQYISAKNTFKLFFAANKGKLVFTPVQNFNNAKKRGLWIFQKN